MFMLFDLKNTFFVTFVTKHIFLLSEYFGYLHKMVLIIKKPNSLKNPKHKKVICWHNSNEPIEIGDFFKTCFLLNDSDWSLHPPSLPSTRHSLRKDGNRCPKHWYSSCCVQLQILRLIHLAPHYRVQPDGPHGMCQLHHPLPCGSG